jgi:hypothetical protein
MQIEHLKINFEKKSKQKNFSYTLYQPASNTVIKKTEERLDLRIPDQVALFYSHYNGLEVENPQLTIIPIEHWEITPEMLIHFSTIDGQYRLCFDTMRLNDANQWSIINCKTGYLVTYTMSSFWTNKIWNWVLKRRTIWEKENMSLF